jgi:dGTPase
VALTSAFPVSASRGRRYPEPAHPYRNDFQRDRDRIIHSRAFRRLEDKTQVFSSRYSDHFRNRLTHTIEVTQIARTVAQAMGLNVDLVEALALVHDVGHPPFGHTGEKCLDEAMRSFGERFDHNVHALRIVEHFEQRYAGFPGLNLSFEVREGILKHSHDYKPGELPAVFDEYLLDQRPPLEAQVIDLCDEIAYNTADLDDGCEAQILDPDGIVQEVPAFAEHYREAEAAWPSVAQKLKFNEALKSLLDALVGDLLESSLAAIRASGVETVEDVRRYPRRLVGFSPAMAARNGQVKDLLTRRLYRNPSLNPERERGAAMVGELFRLYMEDPGRLPHSHQDRASQEPLHHVVCDYIAGMTDSFVRKTLEGLS